MKYLAYMTDGKFNGFYSDDIHTNIPKPNIKVSENLWYKLLEKPFELIISNIQGKSILDMQDYDICFKEVARESVVTPTEPTRIDLLESAVNELLLGGMF